MSFTKENPENSNIPEPDEGFEEPLKSWMSGLSDICMTDSCASRILGRVTCPLPGRGSRYRICTGLTRFSGGMGSRPMFPGFRVFVYSRASRHDRPRTVYRRCNILLLGISTSHWLAVFLLIISNIPERILRREMLQLIFFKKVETKNQRQVKNVKLITQNNFSEENRVKTIISKKKGPKLRCWVDSLTKGSEKIPNKHKTWNYSRAAGNK